MRTTRIIICLLIAALVIGVTVAIFTGAFPKMMKQVFGEKKGHGPIDMCRSMMEKCCKN